MKLGDLCGSETERLTVADDLLIDYIDISSVSNESKSIIGKQTLKSREAPSRAQRILKTNDILVSTVRPNLNAVAVYDGSFKNLAVASTGFCVLRCKPGVNHRFVFNVCKSKAFINALVTQATGASYPAVNDKIICAFEFPDVSYERQEQLAKKLDIIQYIIDLRKQQLRKLDYLIKARFVEMFGEPIANTRRLSTRALRDVLVLKAGNFTAASDIADNPDATYKYPCYGGNGIRGYVEAYNQEGEYSLIGRQGALSGNVQFAKGKFKNTEHALLVTPLIEMNNTWLNQLLINLDLKRYQTGAAQPGLSVKNLQDIPIIVVPIGEQEQFAAFVSQVDKSKLIFVHTGIDFLVIMIRILQLHKISSYRNNLNSLYVS